MSVSKRQEIKAQRLQKKRKQRMTAMVVTGSVILVIVLLIGLPSVIDRYRPAGEFVTITPVAYPLADGRAIGNPNAPVVVEVFEDFQCSACKIFTESTEAELLASDFIANGQVYYIVRNFPFEDNSSAIKASDQAANASMCASGQNRYWDYHAMLYANQDTSSATAFSDRRLIAFAEVLGLDMTQFRSCFNGNDFEVEIQDDVNQAIAYGVNGTPSVFINGKHITPGFVPSYEELITEIEAVLPITQ
jgi:protein-disulfide isomerase